MRYSPGEYEMAFRRTVDPQFYLSEAEFMGSGEASTVTQGIVLRRGFARLLFKRSGEADGADGAAEA